MAQSVRKYLLIKMGFFYSWLLCPCIYFGFLLLWETYWGISRTPWNSLKNPWNFKPINPCLDMQLPWNTYPNPCLEIQGFSRSTSFSPWNFSVTLSLENFWTGHLDFDWTLNFKVNFKEPWNSRLRLFGYPSLILNNLTDHSIHRTF